MWLKLASPPSTSIQGTLYTICRVQQRLQQLNMPHQLVPPLASTAKTEPFQPVAPCPSFSKSPRKSHSAFKPETQRPRLFDPGGHSPHGVFVAWCNVGTFVRLCFGVSCGIARARSFVRDHVRARRGRRGPVVAVAVSRPSWPWLPRPGRHTRRAVPWTSWPSLWHPTSLCRRRVVATRRCMLVFAMVYVVCVDSICLTFVRRV